MTPKDKLKKKFSADPDKYYHVALFDELGFTRKQCEKCAAWFWTLQSDRTVCPNTPCSSYEFIGNSPTKKLDYVRTWKVIERFFVKNGHTSIQSYPVVCRWFPGLYFTIASIVAFQRAVDNKTVFEMPANPLIIPQSCLRFNDIPNVGVTGRHGTNFVMIGQHSIYDEKKKQGYWKDRCIELDFLLLKNIFKIKPEEINFLEDVWVGPNAFGYSLEYYVRGLELGNAVFTEFLGTPENYKHLPEKIIDMGAGLERFTWLTQGTPTYYDAVFGPVTKKLLKLVDYDKNFWTKYMKIAGNFNMEDFRNYRFAKEKAAKLLGMNTEKLIKTTAPVEAIYAIADHSKSILFAVSDGGLPSNVGGGYNLRVILRRALGFIDEFRFDIDLFDVCKMHAKNLRTFNPRLKQGLAELEDILNVEEERYKASRKRGEAIVVSMISKNEQFSDEKLIQLYESHGVTPETIEKIANKQKTIISIPTDFYRMISERHMKEVVEEEDKINLEGLPPTRLLFYEDQNMKEFDAKVLRIINNKYVVLDQTAFYGRAGGQDGDTGFINHYRVYDTEKYGDIIVHLVENPAFKEGDIVRGKIDFERRQQLTKHHTAVHMIHGAARKTLGNHIWQAGANKSAEKAHLDITHYKALTEEEIEKIENLANKMIQKSQKINKYVLSRIEAENRYGFILYQGGAIPHANLRIIDIPGYDVEACSGTHCTNTKEMEHIIITSAERIQDGIVRINIVAGNSAKEYMERQKEILEMSEKILGVKKQKLIPATRNLVSKWKKLKKDLEKNTEQRAKKFTKDLESKIINNVLIAEIEDADMKTLQNVSKQLSSDKRIIILFGIADKIYVFVSAGENSGKDAGKIVRDICEKLGGKGGGSKLLGQGVAFSREKLEDVIKDLENELL